MNKIIAVTADTRSGTHIKITLRIVAETPSNPDELLALPPACIVEYPRPGRADPTQPTLLFLLPDGTEVSSMRNGVQDGRSREERLADLQRFDEAWGDGAFPHVAMKAAEVTMAASLAITASGNEDERLGKALAAALLKYSDSPRLFAGNDESKLREITPADEGETCKGCGKVHGKPQLFADAEPKGAIAGDTKYVRMSAVEFPEAWVVANVEGNLLRRVENLRLVVPMDTVPEYVDKVHEEAFAKHSGVVGHYLFPRCVIIQDYDADNIGYSGLVQYPVFVKPGVHPTPLGNSIVPQVVFESIMEREPTVDELLADLDATVEWIGGHKPIKSEAPATLQ